MSFFPFNKSFRATTLRKPDYVNNENRLMAEQERNHYLTSINSLCADKAKLAKDRDEWKAKAGILEAEVAVLQQLREKMLALLNPDDPMEEYDDD
jgi:hypothetical protein